MKKHLSSNSPLSSATLLLFLTLVFATGGSAQFAFSTNNGVAEITSYSGTNTVVEIPSSIDGCPVTSIGSSAFVWKTAITSVTIPSGVTNIGDSAFGYCYSLAQVNIPEGTVRLGNSAFNQCTSLASVSIPQSVTNIGNTPFSECPNLISINVAAGNALFASDQGVLFDKSLTTLIECPGGKAGDYVVPQATTNIMGWAFDSCRHLTSVALPETLAAIGTAAFYDCGALTNIVVPDKVAVISHSAFGYCTNLLSVSLGTNVAVLEQDCFANCTRLASLTFPDSVRDIGWGAVHYAISLREVHFGSNLVSIGNSAFDSCFQLTSLLLPDSLRTIQSSAFGSCSGLSTVHFGSNLWQLAADSFKDCHQLLSYEVNPENTNYHSLDGVLFNQDFTRLLRFPLGRSGSYQVPASVIEIGPQAFYDCRSLSGIILPDGIRTIGYDAFNSCTSLTGISFPAGITNMQGTALAWCGAGLRSVFFAGNPPVGMDDSAFYGDSNATLYYLPGTTGWTPIFCGRPAVLWNPQPRTDAPGFGVQTNGFAFQITGSENIPVLVEFCTNLSTGVWAPLQTNLLTGGTLDLLDTGWTNNSVRFYRIRSP